MCVLASRLLCLIIGYMLSSTNSNPDADRCISRDETDSSVIELQYCVSSKETVYLFCDPDEIVVWLALQLSVKQTGKACTDRAIDPRNKRCCYAQRNDVLYDSNCLRGLWNKSDTIFYVDFVKETLHKCGNSSQCVMNPDVFRNIQREIPATGKYSSYFNVLYRCIPAPDNAVAWCSSNSVRGHELHIKGISESTTMNNNICTCRVTSEGGGDVIVRALDVRTADSELILRSSMSVKTISPGQLPMYGLDDIFSAKDLSMMVKFRSANDRIWLHISESSGETVRVTCDGTSPRSDATLLDKEELLFDNHETEDAIHFGYWPIIYVAAGSFFTLLVIGCVTCPILIWKHRRKGKRRRQTPHHHDPIGPEYDTVWDETFNIQDPRLIRSMFRQSRGRGHDRSHVLTYPESACKRNTKEPTAPPPPPPNAPGRTLDTSRGSHELMTPSEASQLELLIDHKDLNHTDASSGIGSTHGSSA